MVHSLRKLLEKKVELVSDDAFIEAFEFLKEKLISTPLIISLDWSMSF